MIGKKLSERVFPFKMKVQVSESLDWMTKEMAKKCFDGIVETGFFDRAKQTATKGSFSSTHIFFIGNEVGVYADIKANESMFMSWAELDAIRSSADLSKMHWRVYDGKILD